MTNTIADILKQYYHDYLTAQLITSSEFEELVELFGIICDRAGSALNETDKSIREALLDLLGGKVRADLGLTCTGPYMDKIQELRSREISGDQRTAEWLASRNSYITASISAVAAGLMGPASRHNLLLEKASNGSYRSFTGGYYTDIGNIFEPVTNSSYSILNNKRIHDFALIPHSDPEYDYLGASTDGVSSTLTNIEIKTLPGRVPDGKVKKLYYHQMQHQMECLGLKTTDFIEVKYNEHASLADMPADTEDRGVIIELYDVFNGCFEYEYSPCVNKEISGIKTWMDTRDKIIRDYDGLVFVRYIYWSQAIYSCIKVDRDPKWIVTMGPLLKKFWDEVTELRANPSKVTALINEKVSAAHAKKNRNNPLFTKCLLE